MINNLSDELNIMRPSLLETGLETISWNINRKNSDLLFFEFGKTYETRWPGKYTEINHLLSVYYRHLEDEQLGRPKAENADLYYLKGNLFCHMSN